MTLIALSIYLPKELFITGLIVTLYATTVSSLKCLQCNSMENPNCETGYLDPSPCDVNKNKYCYKYSGEIDKREFVFRGCDKKYSSKPCHKKEMHGELIDICYHYCSTDGCNSSTSLSINHITTLLPPLIAYILSHVSSFSSL